MLGTKVAVREVAPDMAHILVVDDERSICELLQITFREEGYRVEVANSVGAAQRKVESQLFDMVMSDERLVAASGRDSVKVTKEIARESVVLLVAAVPALDAAIAARNSGAERYVVKGDALVHQLLRTVQEGSDSPK